jgi:ribose/xylose/arabinose/galactoside ABC-type transport system permease subunit
VVIEALKTTTLASRAFADRGVGNDDHDTRQSTAWRIFEGIRSYGLILAFALGLAILAVALPNFASESNLMTIARSAALTGIMACGMTVAMIAGGFDLSVARVAALVAMVVAMLSGSGPLIALGAGLLLSVFVGLLNGVLIQKAKINPFIITLGMYSVAGSAALLVNDGGPIYDVGSWLTSTMRDPIGPWPLDVWMFILVALVLHLVLRYTKFGYNVYAIGGNEEAARRAGARVDTTIITTYVIVSVCAGIAGILLTARSQSASPVAFTGGELTVIAAAIIGGTRLGGGVGHIGRTVVGAVLLSCVSNALILANTSPYWQGAVTGAILIVAVVVDLKLTGMKS